MKIKYLVFSLLCAFPTLLFSQIASQNFIVEGSAAAQILERNNDSEFVLAVSPTISYFLSDKFVVGGGFLLATNLETGTNFGLNGKARYYFTNQAYNVWFVESKLGFVTGRRGFNLFTGDIGLGLDLFLSPNIAVETILSAGFQKEGDIIGNTIVFQLGTGLKFFFDRRPEGAENGRNGILQKGTIFLGMTAGNIQIAARNGSRVSEISLSPNIGKFITKNWVIGANINLQNRNFSEANFFQMGAVPYIRYYLNAAEKRAIFFGELGGGIQLSAFSGDSVVNETTIDPTFNFGLGVNYFLRPTVAFEVKGSYSNFRQSSFIDVNAIGLNFGFQFFLGRR